MGYTALSRREIAAMLVHWTYVRDLDSGNVFNFLSAFSATLLPGSYATTTTELTRTAIVTGSPWSGRVTCPSNLR